MACAGPPSTPLKPHVRRRPMLSDWVGVANGAAESGRLPRVRRWWRHRKCFNTEEQGGAPRARRRGHGASRTLHGTDGDGGWGPKLATVGLDCRSRFMRLSAPCQPNGCRTLCALDSPPYFSVLKIRRSPTGPDLPGQSTPGRGNPAAVHAGAISVRRRLNLLASFAHKAFCGPSARAT